MKSLGRFPFWAFDYPNLRSLLIDAEVMFTLLPLSLGGRFIIPSQPLPKLTKLVLKFSPAFTALFRSPQGHTLNESFPNLTYLEVQSKEYLVAECFSNLPSNLETLCIYAMNLDFTPALSSEIIGRLPRSLLALRIPLGGGFVGATSTFNFPPNLTDLELPSVYDYDIFAAFPHTLTRFSSCPNAANGSIYSSSLPSKLKSLLLSPFTPVPLVLDAPLPPSLDFISITNLQFVTASGGTFTDTSSLLGAMGHTVAVSLPFGFSLYDGVSRPRNWSYQRPRPQFTSDVTHFDSLRMEETLALDMMALDPTKLVKLQMQDISADIWAILPRFKKLQSLVLHQWSCLHAATDEVLSSIGPQVTDLDLSGSELTDLSFLKHFKNLSNLKLFVSSLSAEFASSDDALAYLPESLENLEIEANTVAHAPCKNWFSPLSRLSRLRELDVFMTNHIVTFNSFLRSLPRNLSRLRFRAVSGPLTDDDDSNWADLTLLPPRLQHFCITARDVPYSALKWGPLPSSLAIVQFSFAQRESIDDDCLSYFPPGIYSIKIGTDEKGPEYELVRSEIRQLGL